MDFKIAWRNIWRNPRRSVLTICAISFACIVLIFMLSFQFGSYETMINTSVKIQTGHLQIQARGYHEKKDIRLVVTDPDRIGKIVSRIPQVTGFTFRAQAFSLVSKGKRTYGVLVNGIDPLREKTVSRLKALVRKGHFLAEGDSNVALLGNLLSKNLRASIGDEVTVLGQARDGSIAASVLRVKGVFNSGIPELDRSTLLMPLSSFSELYSMGGGVHQIVIVLDSLSRVPQVKKALALAIKSVQNDPPLTVMDWEELIPGLRQGIEMDLISGMIFYLILILVVAFSIMNTFLMAIFERTREFGVLMAIGLTPGRLTRLLLMESLGLTTVGIAIGMLAGVLITYYFQRHGIDVSGVSDLLSQFGISGRLHPRLSPLSVTIGPAAVLVITFVAAIYPALKVRSFRPVEAMAAI